MSKQKTVETSKFKEITTRLNFPTPRPLIKHRSAGVDRNGNKIILDYVEWYNYAAILDDLCTDYWYPEVRSMIQVGTSVCIAVRLHIDGFYVDNVGSEGNDHTDPAALAYAQAFKRCCAMLGLTRDLYYSKDDKTGLWKTVEASRQETIKDINKLLKVKQLSKTKAAAVKRTIKEDRMHYNMAINTLEHLKTLNNKEIEKAKPSTEGDEK